MAHTYSCHCGVCATCRHRAYVARNRPAVQAAKRENQRKIRASVRSQAFSLEDAERLPMSRWVELTEDQVWSVVNQYLDEVLP